MSSPTNQTFWQSFFSHRLRLYAVVFFFTFAITYLFVLLSLKTARQAEQLQRLEKLQNRIELLEKEAERIMKAVENSVKD